jgi:hypothetical protein
VGNGALELDRPVVPGDTPYAIEADPGAIERVAVSLAEGAALTWSIVDFALESRTGGALDFKGSEALPDRTLWYAGDGRLVHSDVVGNAAWGRYAATRTQLPLDLALAGAHWYTRLTKGTWDDPQDQEFIRRGYGYR